MLRNRTMGLAAAIVLAASAFGFAHAATDNAFEREAKSARTEAFEGARPGAGFTRADDLAGSWSVVTVYVQGPQSAHGRWVARRVAKLASGGKVTAWTDAASCPALATALALLERLAPQRLEIQGMSPYRPMRTYVADGAVQTVWSLDGAQPDGTPIAVEWSSNAGALAHWGEETERALAACWTPSLPR